MYKIRTVMTAKHFFSFYFYLLFFWMFLKKILVFFFLHFFALFLLAAYLANDYLQQTFITVSFCLGSLIDQARQIEAKTELMHIVTFFINLQQMSAEIIKFFSKIKIEKKLLDQQKKKKEREGTSYLKLKNLLHDMRQ